VLCCSYSDVGLADANVKTPVYAYLDTVQVWLKPPLSRKEWAWVNAQVSHPLLGYPIHIQCGGRQRLILTQPSEACLRFFADRDGVQGNRVELALDIITPFASQLKHEASVGFLQRRHGTRQSTIFPGDNFRTADLGCRGPNFQAYDDKPSKVYGETDCFHLEAKINGAVSASTASPTSSPSIMLVSGSATSSSPRSTWLSLGATTPTAATEPGGVQH